MASERVADVKMNPGLCHRAHRDIVRERQRPPRLRSQRVSLCAACALSAAALLMGALLQTPRGARGAVLPARLRATSRVSLRRDADPRIHTAVLPPHLPHHAGGAQEVLLRAVRPRDRALRRRAERAGSFLRRHLRALDARVALLHGLVLLQLAGVQLHCCSGRLRDGSVHIPSSHAVRAIFEPSAVAAAVYTSSCLRAGGHSLRCCSGAAPVHQAQTEAHDVFRLCDQCVGGDPDLACDCGGQLAGSQGAGDAGEEEEGGRLQQCGFWMKIAASDTASSILLLRTDHQRPDG